MSYETAKARLEAATPGEWIRKTVWSPVGNIRQVAVDADFDPVVEPTEYLRIEDAEFIAHSKQDMEAALEVVRCVDTWFKESADGDLSRLGERYKDTLNALAKFEKLP